ncbi:MAG: hypothetical protein JXN61_11835 [Sedimentisphaerales bacterium]|nr:hypothetical protein [Sedimentisphaerales bacterium]
MKIKGQSRVWDGTFIVERRGSIAYWRITACSVWRAGLSRRIHTGLIMQRIGSKHWKTVVFWLNFIIIRLFA